MNPAFKRYGKIKYKHTRYGRKRLAGIKAMRHAMIAVISAQAYSQTKIIASTPYDRANKVFEMVECASKAVDGIKSVYDRFPNPE